MVENNEIRTTPTLAGRIVEGVKEGVVGIAVGAAAGAVTGGVLAGMEFDSTSEVAKEAANNIAITPEQMELLNSVGKTVEVTAETIANDDAVIKTVGDQTMNAAFRQAIIDGKENFIATGAIAGGTFKGLEGVLSNQNDKRQDMDHQRQEQEIQGVGQLASMALAASASANQGLEVLGTHTARLLKERGQQNLAQPASHVERVQQQRIDATPSLGA
jgi:hypothetical protein